MMRLELVDLGQESDSISCALVKLANRQCDATGAGWLCLAFTLGSTMPPTIKVARDALLSSTRGARRRYFRCVDMDGMALPHH